MEEKVINIERIEDTVNLFGNFDENIKSVMSAARPFSRHHDKQVKALLNLGCNPLIIDKNKLSWFLRNYENSLYSTNKVQLCKKVIVDRLNYYKDWNLYVWS